MFTLESPSAPRSTTVDVSMRVGRPGQTRYHASASACGRRIQSCGSRRILAPVGVRRVEDEGGRRASLHRLKQLCSHSKPSEPLSPVCGDATTAWGSAVGGPICPMGWSDQQLRWTINVSGVLSRMRHLHNGSSAPNVPQNQTVSNRPRSRQAGTRAREQEVQPFLVRHRSRRSADCSLELISCVQGR